MMVSKYICVFLLVVVISCLSSAFKHSIFRKSSYMRQSRTMMMVSTTPSSLGRSLAVSVVSMGLFGGVLLDQTDIVYAVSQQTTDEAQAAASAAVKRAIASKGLAPPAKKGKKVEEKSQPKRSVEEVALLSQQDKQKNSKERLTVVMKQELPKARDALKKAKTEQKELNKKIDTISNQQESAKKKKDSEMERLLNAEKSDVKSRLGFINQEVSGFTKAVERAESESLRLKKEIDKQGDVIKDLKQRYDKKTEEMRKKAEKNKADARRQEMNQAKAATQRRVSSETSILKNLQKDASQKIAFVKKLKDKSGAAEVDLKVAKKNEEKRIKLINDLRRALQKEMEALDKEQVTIVNIANNVNALSNDIANANKEVSVKEAELKAIKAKLNTAENELKKYGK